MATQHVTKQSEQEKVIPFRPMNMLEEMERMFENFIPHGWMRPLWKEHALGAEYLPQMDVIEQDDNIVVRAALPGVIKEDLEVSTTNHTLTVRGSTYRETQQKGKGEYFRREISSGSFLRTVSLPAAVDETRISAVFKDGMLEVTLPKIESAKRHTIEIKS